MKYSTHSALVRISGLVLLGLGMMCLPAFMTTGRAGDSGFVPGSKLAGGRRLAYSHLKLPLSFEANAGQADARVRFISRGRGYTLLLTANEAALTLQGPRPSVVNRHVPSIGDKAAQAADMLPSPLLRNPASQMRTLPAPGARHSSPASFRMRLVGANPAAQIKGLGELPGKSNYFLGNDMKKWRTNIPTYAKVKYEGIYPGIDLVYYGVERQLEYDFVVAPHADAGAIRLALDAGNSDSRAGAPSPMHVRLDPSGDLLVQTAGGEVRFHKPVVYQPSSASSGRQSAIDNRQSLDGCFVLLANNQVGFSVGAYDRTRPLIIDPVMSYSTYLGGSGDDYGYAIAVDSSGSAYVAGTTCTTSYVSDRSGCDAVVSKLNSAGTGLVYSTVFGGSDYDLAYSVALDSSGNVYTTGSTCSSDFPYTTGAYQTALAGSACDAFVTKLNSSGSQVYSTFLGGSGGDEIGLGIAADASGNAYVAGQTCSDDFPTLKAFDDTFHGGGVPPCDGFAAKLNPAGGGASDLLYSTYLGGDENDDAQGVALDSSGLVYVSGITASTDFPTTSGAYQTSSGGSFDAFVAKLDMTKSGSDSLLYCTYLGGSIQEEEAAIALDSSGNVYVAGTTLSHDFPATSGAFQTANNTDPSVFSFKAFVAKLNLAGGGASDLLYATYLGGSGEDEGFGVATGASGNAYVTGLTCSDDFPLTSDAFQTAVQNQCDAFVAEINPAGGGTSDLVFSTYLGGNGNDYGQGIALDSSANAYVTGATNSTDFPHSTDAYQTSFGGGPYDAFVARIPVGNFSLSSISDITADVGGSGSSSATVNSIGEFNAPVDLTVSGQPSGVAASFDPTSVTPSAGGSASSTLTVNLGLAVTPGTFSLNVLGASGLLSHSTTAQVTVQASSSGTSTVVTGLQAAGCIDNSGISGALIDKLNKAQSYIDAGQTQDAINTLTALLNEFLAQAGKHITSSCTANGQTFNPVMVLINDVRSILASLKIGSTPNPILGYVVNSGDAGLSGATVSILDPSNVVVASAATDSTGFYFFENTGSLSLGMNYTVMVTGFSPGYKVSTPASQAFTWNGTAIALGDFTLTKK